MKELASPPIGSHWFSLRNTVNQQERREEEPSCTLEKATCTHMGTWEERSHRAVVMWRGIRKARILQGSRERKYRLRVDG
jgi:hypothetical protein